MAEWEIAIQKHNPVICAGYEKRATKGDLIAYKAVGGIWTDGERNSFNIVILDGITEPQMEALLEQYYDADSYPDYVPISFEQFYIDQLIKADQKIDPTKVIALIEANKDVYYQNYLKSIQEYCSFPGKYLKKRRFMILEKDIAKKISYTKVWDKLNNRYVSELDGLTFIKPLTVSEMEAKVR